MARGSAAAKSTDLATSGNAALAASVDKLAEMGLAEIDIPTGTEELGRDDVRMPFLVFNTKHVPKDGDEPISPKAFLNTVTEEVKTKLRLQVLNVHKTRQYAVGEGESRRTVCRSSDKVVGIMEDGSTRPCNDQCPDYQWRKGADGKNARNCHEASNLLSIDLDTSDIVTLRLRKTAKAPFGEFYQKHFHKKRPLPGGKRVDYPLFLYETHVECKMESKGGFTWAIPRFELGEMMGAEHVQAGAELVREFAQTFRDRIAASESDADYSGGSDDDSGAIDTTAFVDDEKPGDARFG